jgi:FlaA1/EpsC-like NDP-sugar epimerase
VFHAAAYKHVPILEQFPQEGVRVNILGTKIIHSLAEFYGAERFVLISSDKAVNPSNVLGMTKWIGELIATSRRTNSRMLSTAVRFGNVLGSRGSVLPTFEKQIELGGPITITHPDMTRYFLTISEAVSLVIQAAAMTRGGDLYALDMGVPVRIVDLAQRMIRARGLRPGQDIAIEYTGMRPGEKLNEELIAPAEETCPTEHQAIFRIERRVTLALGNLEQEIDQMVAFSANGSGADSVHSALRSWVMQLQSTASIPVSLPTVQA